MTEYIIKATNKGDIIRYSNYYSALPVGLAELRERNWHIIGVRKVELTDEMLHNMGLVSTTTEEQNILHEWYELGMEVKA